MASFELITDETTGIVTCRIHGFVSDEDADRLAADLLAKAAVERRRQGLRLLFDNRSGTVFSSAAMQALADQLHANRHPTDRTAILVANSLNKLQAKRAINENSQVFLSESAAMTWLCAWDDRRDNRCAAG